MKTAAIFRICLLLMMWGCARTAAAQEPNFPWDFSGTNAPSTRDSVFDYPKTKCLNWPDKLFSAYKKKRPAFAQIADQKRARKEWRKALIGNMAARDMDVLCACFYRLLWQRNRPLLETGTVTRLPHCGRPLSGEAAVQLEELEELTEYAMQGHAFAIIYLSTAHEYSGVALHPDIRYAMMLHDIARNAKYEDGSWLEEREEREVYTSGRELTPMRREFIERAIGKDDWKAVLDSIDPCAPPLDASRT